MKGKLTTDILLNFSGNTNNNNITLTSSQMPSHSHSSTISAHTNNHTHTYQDETMNDGVNSGQREDFIDGNIYNKDISRTTNGVSHNHGNLVTSSAGNGTSFSILNACYIVNWIAKI
jgi:microcystin-dependent protein